MKKATNTRDGNCVLLDPEKGWYVTHRDNPPGEPLKFRGQFVHLCVQDGDQLVAVDLPNKTGDPPERIYRARYWPEVRILYGMRPTWLEKLDRGLWLGALGILSLLTFMLVASMLG